MKISELLGASFELLDPKIDSKEPVIGGIGIEIVNRPDVQEVEADEQDRTDTTTMVAPLQQKLELLKRAVGVDNMYDADDHDELAEILKIAGVPVATIFDAGDDEPLDS